MFVMDVPVPARHDTPNSNTFEPHFTWPLVERHAHQSPDATEYKKYTSRLYTKRMGKRKLSDSEGEEEEIGEDDFLVGNERSFFVPIGHKGLMI